MTADNASNNGTMMRRLDQLLTADSGKDNTFKASSSTIRCLAHVIHLAVMDLLVAVKAVEKPNGRGGSDSEVNDETVAFECDLAADLDEEEAEKLGNDDEVAELGNLTDAQIEERQNKEDAAKNDAASPVKKVRA